MFARGFRYHRLSEIVRISRVSRSSDLAVGFVSPPRQRGAAMHFSHSLPGARGEVCRVRSLAEIDYLGSSSTLACPPDIWGAWKVRLYL